MEEIGSPGLKVRARHLHDLDFRVETDGVSMDVSLAAYFKVIAFLCMDL